MTKKELLKSPYIGYTESYERLYKEFYIIPQKELHDSGYKCIMVIGKTKENEYYKITNGSDVIDLQQTTCKVCFDVSPKNNILRMFVNAPNKYFKIIFNCSNFSLEVVDDN